MSRNIPREDDTIKDTFIKTQIIKVKIMNHGLFLILKIIIKILIPLKDLF